MKKTILWLFVVLMSIAPTFAIEGDTGVQGMARFFPDQTDVFASSRIDEDFITTLQGLLNNAITKFPPETGILPVDVLGQFNQAIEDSGLTYADLQVFLGDHIAFGMDGFELSTDANPENDDKVAVMVALELSDRASFELFFAQAPNIENLEFLEDLDGFSVYVDREEDLQISIGQEVVYLSTIGDLPRTDTPRLNTLADFRASIGELPAESYNILLYANLRPLADMLTQMDDSAQGLVEGILQSITMGATILDGRALTIDLVQTLPDSTITQQLNADFIRGVPAETQLLGWGANLTQIIDTTIDQFNDLNAMQGDTGDIRAQLQGLVRFAGIDLEQDLLSWTTGDYAVIGAIDADSILAAITSVPNFETLPLSFGLLLEATDETTARDFADKLGAFIARTMGEEPSVTVTDGTLDDEQVWTISTEIPLDPSMSPLQVNIDMGVSQGTFYIATRDVAAQLRRGGASLADDERFQFASRYFLPDPISLLYTDDEGVVVIVGTFGLVIIGPAIGNVFDNIMDGLQTWAPTRTLIDTRAQGQGPAEAILQVYDTLLAIIHSTSSTTQISPEGYGITRLVLVLEE